MAGKSLPCREKNLLTDKKCCYINKKQWKRFTKIHKCFKSENHLTAKKNNVTIVAMDNRLRNKKRMTLQDVADALNMSKTTVSRALSGKGRIGEDTRRAVIDFAKEHDYHPNLMAKGLAEAKTWNIGVVLQGNASRADMPFFQNCLFGIASEVKSHNYDVLLVLNDENSSDGLLQMLRLGKADAVILTRVMENDKNVELLKEHSIPFVAIGSYNDDSVIQVDAKNEEACRSFTLEVVKRAGNAGKIIFLCGKQNIIVNKMRLNGFLEAMNELGKSDYSVTLDIESAKEAKEALSGFDGSIVICADDVLCEGAIEWENERYNEGSSEVKIASFHDSLAFSCSSPKVSAIDVDAYTLGKTASELLLSCLCGKEVESRNYVDYNFLFR